MPTLPVPLGGAALNGGDLPVSDGDDVLREFPDTHRVPETADVRDDLCAAFAVSHIVYQDTAAKAIAQTDPLRATGDYLASIAIEREVVPRKGESQSSLRARLFAPPKIVTPDAIVEEVNKILAEATTVECELLELELDGLFIHDGTVTAWDSFIGAQPRYPDRYYEEDAAENDGFFLTNNNPGGALVSMGLPRNFHLRIPILDVLDEEFAFAIDSTDGITLMTVGDGTDVSGAETSQAIGVTVFDGEHVAGDLYAAIVGLVESIKGQSISWSVYVDPVLVA